MNTSTLNTPMLDEKPKFEKWVHLWGCAISEAALDSRFQFFQVPSIEGAIGYKIESGCAITFGDPICSKANQPQLALAFHNYFQEKKIPIVYMATTEEFACWAITNICHVMIEVGEEIIFNPQIDHLEGPKANRLRNKIHHAEKSGLTVQEYIPSDPQIEQAILEVGQEWQKNRKGPQVYLGTLAFFSERMNKRWFYISEKGHVIGMALLSRLDCYDGWLLKFLITIPDSPRGASELLMSSILETLRKENCRFLTFGMVPAENLGKITGLGKLTQLIARKSFKVIKWIFNLNQRKVYWQKFQPTTKPIYILFSRKHLGIPEIRAMTKSLKINF